MKTKNETTLSFSRQNLQWVLTTCLAVCTLLFFSACTPKEKSKAPLFQPEVVVDELSVGPLKNCKFSDPQPAYNFQTNIPPNTIQCEEGVPTHVELLSDLPLPSGLRWDAQQMALIGSANEKVSQAPYQFYLKNAAGYIIIPLKITVK